MIETILGYIELISNGNEMIKTAIIGVFTLGVTSFVGYVLRDIPSSILHTIIRQLTVNIVIDDHGYQNEMMFHEIDVLLASKTNNIGTREHSISIKDDENRKMSDVLGFGTHWIIYNKRLLKVVKEKIDSGNRHYNKINIASIGFSPSFIYEIIDKIKMNVESSPDFIVVDKNGYVDNGGDVPYSPLDNLCLSKETYDMITTNIEFFINNKDKYTKLNISHKLTMLLYGEPGTGKTSIIRSIASTYGLNMAVIDLKEFTDNTLSTIISNLPKNTILLLEDIDCMTSSVNRDSKQSGIEGVSLSGILNALDGVIPLDGIIVAMTTNHIDKLDPALIRNGRTDLKIELPYLEPDIINSYFSRIYDHEGFNCPVKMKACDLTDIKINAKFNKNKALELVNNYRG